MNLVIWIPLTFALGVGLFGACYWFVNLCEKI